jgi:hypothetical protein
VTHLTFRPSFFQEFQARRATGGRSSENVPTVLRLLGDVEADAMRSALAAMVARHEALRTALITEPVLHQRVQLEASIPLRVIALQRSPTAWRMLRQLVLAERAEPFALDRAPLARATLVRLGRRDQVLVFTISHIFWDAASKRIFVTELGRHLEAFAAGRRSSGRPPPAVQFGDWVEWQRSLHRPDRERFWAQRLLGASALIAVQPDRPRRPADAIGLSTAVVSAALVARLNGVAQRLGTTLAITVLTAYAIAVAGHTGRAEATVAMTHVNRDRPELAQVIGFCSDAFLVRLALGRSTTGAQCVGAVHAWIAASHRHWLPIERQLAHVDRGPALQTQPAMHEAVLNLTPAASATVGALGPPAPGSVELRAIEAPVRRLSPDAGWHNAAILVNLAPDGRGALRGRVEFNPHTLDEAAVAAFLARWHRALTLLALRPGERVSRDGSREPPARERDPGQLPAGGRLARY